MAPGFLLALREGLEAALIIGIVLGVLNKLNQTSLKVTVWQGVGAAAGLAVLFGLGLNWMGMKLEGAAEEIFEGITMLLAAGVLTWMILWMQRQGVQIQSKLEAETAHALPKGRQALFFLAFIAVFREGIELALFLVATSLVVGSAPTLIGSGLGLIVAAALGALLFASTRRLSMRKFFQVTNILLILFAAGLVGLGVHELNEAGWIPEIVAHVYDINGLLDDKSELGLVLKALLGYNGNPSLTEVAAYLAYFLLLSINFIRFQQKQNLELSRQTA